MDRCKHHKAPPWQLVYKQWWWCGILLQKYLMWKPLSKNGDDQLLQLSNVNQKAALDIFSKQAAVPRLITQERFVPRLSLYKIIIRDLNISYIFWKLPTNFEEEENILVHWFIPQGFHSTPLLARASHDLPSVSPFPVPSWFVQRYNVCRGRFLKAD